MDIDDVPPHMMDLVMTYFCITLLAFIGTFILHPFLKFVELSHQVDLQQAELSSQGILLKIGACVLGMVMIMFIIHGVFRLLGMLGLLGWAPNFNTWMDGTISGRVAKEVLVESFYFISYNTIMCFIPHFGVQSFTTSDWHFEDSKELMMVNLVSVFFLVFLAVMSDGIGLAFQIDYARFREKMLELALHIAALHFGTDFLPWFGILTLCWFLHAVRIGGQTWLLLELEEFRRRRAAAAARRGGGGGGAPPHDDGNDVNMMMRHAGLRIRG
ncbi:OLC1v1022279C1 [Oldenlandia corymbosa var. corymbosa]|uniref:OLC1v1022279C1 n=1 Tax=Oldenlandia corymbosa var. corymbosa TaxID=529605 RepID=A0AAV1BXI2_OLDCO|nr:OLC1v1022279C1 [Oldenlandia corymbosa var. corymbosa]